MSPLTHLLSSWVIGAKATNNSLDCRLVALAGIAPDLDGLGLIVDAINHGLGRKSLFYEHYHHYLLHGWLGACLIALLLAAFGRQKIRVALLCLLVFHLHLLLDFVGSRGPSPEDLWAIFYHGPFDRDPMWVWKGQLRLDGWFNRWFSVALFCWSLWIGARIGHTPLGVFSARADRTFVGILQKWKTDLLSFRNRRARA